jgi:hypothetical protein
MAVVVALLTINPSMKASDRPLVERRAIDTLVKETIPAYEAKLATALGRQVPITLDVESLPLGLAVFDFFEQRALDTLVNGLPQVASDDLGKEALESKVQSVRLVYDKTVETVDKAVNFEDKTLVLPLLLGRASDARR